MKRYHICLLALVLLINTIFAQAKTDVPATLKIANVLQNSMVIQQGKPFKLWGWAPAGETINITTDWNKKPLTLTADAAGNWLGQISVPKVKAGDFTPHTITIKDNDKTITLTDILIGELWFCAGQSNMDMPVKAATMMTYPGALNWEKEIAAANFPAIRLYRTAAEFRVVPQADTKGTWKVCSPATAGDFSATAYFFGRQLFLKLNTPIGLVVSAVPGASTQAFTKRAVLEVDTNLKRVYLDPQNNLVSNQKKVDTTGYFSLVTKPTLIYNGMINPLFNLQVKGIIYYQGESNARSDKRGEYINLFTSMLADWRRDFKQGDLPFYLTQIAPYREDNETAESHDAAYFRETQQQLTKIKNTGIAVLLDAGLERKVHPPDKRSAGERLAKNALNKTYRLKDVQYTGPIFKKYQAEGNIIILSYDKTSVGTGLITKDGKAPTCFFVAGDDKKFYPADAKIVGDEVLLSNFKVANPVAIRYAYSNWAGTNLQNREGLPAMQFRTDTWQ